jgi:hypothetical protein
MSKMKTLSTIAWAALLLIAAGSCNDINRQESPVLLVVTNTQTLHRLDLAQGAVGCDQSLATVNITSVLLQGPIQTGITGANLNQVRLTTYRVSYVRVDGGHLVPAPFVRATSGLVAAGNPTPLSNLVAFEANALNLAPFAALRPENGARDPETGKPIITMNLILEIFGETLAGERVKGTTQMTVDFCVSCNGCA